VAAQALRRYVSTPLDNLACLAIPAHLQRWPRRYGGYVPATSAGKRCYAAGGDRNFLITIWSDLGHYLFSGSGPC